MYNFHGKLGYTIATQGGYLASTLYMLQALEQYEKEAIGAKTRAPVERPRYIDLRDLSRPDVNETTFLEKIRDLCATLGISFYSNLPPPAPPVEEEAQPEEAPQSNAGPSLADDQI